VTDDRRQTDHVTEKCVGIGGIACTTRAIPPDKAIPPNNRQISMALLGRDFRGAV